MVIQTKRKDLFYNWLLYLDPILNLTQIQRKVLSALLTLHYYHRHRYSDLQALNDTLFSEENLQGVQEKLKIPKKNFLKAFEELTQKGLIEKKLEEVKEPTDISTSYSLSKYLTQYPRDSKFKIQIDFEIID